MKIAMGGVTELFQLGLRHGVRVIFATIPTVQLSKYNRCAVEASEQKKLNVRVKALNDYLISHNRSNNLTTPMLHQLINKTRHSHTSHIYKHMYDGVHLHSYLRDRASRMVWNSLNECPRTSSAATAGGDIRIVVLKSPSTVVREDREVDDKGVTEAANVGSDGLKSHSTVVVNEAGELLEVEGVKETVEGELEEVIRVTTFKYLERDMQGPTEQNSVDHFPSLFCLEDSGSEDGDRYDRLRSERFVQ